MAVVLMVLAPAAVGLLDAQRRWLDDGLVAAERSGALRIASSLRDGEEVARLDRFPTTGRGRAGAATAWPAGPYLLVSAHAGTPRGHWSVHVIGSLASAEAPMSGLRSGVQLGLPALVLLVGAMTWLLNSRSLRPVETLRAETVEIVRRRLTGRLEGRPTRGHTARLDEARGRSRGGAGLGLAIARQVVAAHGGRIWVAGDGSVTGARLIVRLPRGSRSS